MNAFWNSLGKGARLGLLSGAGIIIFGVIAVGLWLLRSEQQVLFSDLKPQDSAAMIAELERMKVPYRISTDGQAILVDKEVVHSTRMKLMGRDLPLHGAVGFELFNNSEFGMTEFAQKINYQRALQGEITRTILALAEIRDARVHLALPDEGLFKRATTKGKASVTLHLQAGRTLRPEQITGIQRLVSASVTGIAAQDVTIVDNQGVVLNRVVVAGGQGGQGGESEGGSTRLDLKKDTEQILSRKVSEVLDKAFGAGQALASVDVTLNMDQLRVTTEEVIANPARTGLPATGVVTREREILREAAPSLEARAGDVGLARGRQSQREVDYQVGKRVEHLTSTPGAIRRIQVVAIVRRPLEAAQLDQLRVLVSAAVGAIAERGDQVVVQSLAGLGASAGQGALPATLDEGFESDLALPASSASNDRTNVRSEVAIRSDRAIAVSLALLMLAVLAFGFTWAWSRRQTSMTLAQREAALARVQAWLANRGEGDALRG